METTAIDPMQLAKVGLVAGIIMFAIGYFLWGTLDAVAKYHERGLARREQAGVVDGLYIMMSNPDIFVPFMLIFWGILIGAASLIILLYYFVKGFFA